MSNAPQHRRLSSRWQSALAAYSLITPALVLMLLMLIGPVLAVLVISFTDWQLGAKQLSFIGLENYQELWTDRVFWISISNTMLYVLVVVPGSLILGLLTAMLIESVGQFKAFYRAVFFIPVMATLIAMAISWEFMLHPQFGLINLLLKAVGLPTHNWLNERDLVLYVLAAIGIWQSFGFNMVLFLAGLVAIPRQLYEAAEMDGAASAWDKFWLVTWPMLGPVTLFVAVISTIKSFQIFDTVHVLTKGGPNKASEVLIYTIYAEGFQFFRSGYAAAVTVVFLVFVLLLTLFKMRVADRRVHYA